MCLHHAGRSRGVPASTRTAMALSRRASKDDREASPAALSRTMLMPPCAEQSQSIASFQVHRFLPELAERVIVLHCGLVGYMLSFGSLHSLAMCANIRTIT